MKNVFFVAVVAFMSFLSCRNDESGIQKIDQVFHLYIDSAGIDMLNSKIEGAYFTSRANDVYGLTDSSPVNFTTKMDADSVNYFEYVAGAVRKEGDTIAATKIYESKIALILTKKVNDSVNATTNDTLRIRYTATPELFQVSKIWYNKQLKFIKIEGEPNIVKISK